MAAAAEVVVADEYVKAGEQKARQVTTGVFIHKPRSRPMLPQNKE